MEKSDCCNAEVKMSEPAPDFLGIGDEMMVGTCHYICSKCGKTCNLKKRRSKKTKLGVIDVERKGNLLRVYYGNITKDYGGDDWDDAPYEHNCGLVYEEYVKETEDITVPWEYEVYEPRDFYTNSPFRRNDFKSFKVPAVFVSKDAFMAERTWQLESAKLPAIRFGMSKKEVDEFKKEIKK